MPPVRIRTKAEQGEATRAKLVRVSRQLFATRGYAKTSIQDITGRAKVTRGALYHHFADKRDVFLAVFEDVERDLGVQIGAAVAEEKRPERRLKTGLNAFLDACLDRDVQRIVLIDAPSVLGWETWHEIDAAYGLGMTRQGLEQAMADGVIVRTDPEPLAHLLLGALNEAGLAIARADDVQAARRRFGRSLERLIDGLRPSA